MNISRQTFSTTLRGGVEEALECCESGGEPLDIVFGNPNPDLQGDLSEIPLYVSAADLLSAIELGKEINIVFSKALASLADGVWANPRFYGITQTDSTRGRVQIALNEAGEDKIFTGAYSSLYQPISISMASSAPYPT